MMTYETLTIGDVLMLNSGGPAMTVTEKQETEFMLVWFSEDGLIQSSRSRPEMLVCFTRPHQYN